VNALDSGAEVSNLQHFQSRRPDSNRRPLHYEALGRHHSDLALRRSFCLAIPHSSNTLFRIHSAYEPTDEIVGE
jgi:hypothetical protein